MASTGLRYLAFARRVRWRGGSFPGVGLARLERTRRVWEPTLTAAQQSLSSTTAPPHNGSTLNRKRAKQKAQGTPQRRAKNRREPGFALPANAPPRHVTADGAVCVGDSTGFSMGVQFLGTASTFPTTCRGTSALTVSFRCGSIWLFDCGEGTQLQLRRVSRLSLSISLSGLS